MYIIMMHQKAYKDYVRVISLCLQSLIFMCTTAVLHETYIATHYTQTDHNRNCSSL